MTSDNRNPERKSRWTPVAFAFLAVVGFAQMAGDVFHLNAIKAVAAATTASPAPKVFSAVKGLETYSSRFYIESASGAADAQSVEITPELYSRLRGPYNRRNVFGAVLAYGPVLLSEAHTRPLFEDVSRYALCSDAPLLRELGIPTTSLRPPVRVRIEVRPGSKTESLPLVLQVPCR
jgi:hypothetical protein